MISTVIYVLGVAAFVAFGIGMLLAVSDLRKRHESDRKNTSQNVGKKKEEMVYSD